MVFERADCAFSGIAAVHAGGGKLKVDVRTMQEIFEDGRGFIVEALEFGLEPGSDEGMEGRFVGG